MRLIRKLRVLVMLCINKKGKEMCVICGCHLCLKERSRTGKLDKIFCSGLNIYGSGRIEESLSL